MTPRRAFLLGFLVFFCAGWISGPQGSGGGGSFTGGAGSPIDSLVLDVANGDVHLSRGAASELILAGDQNATTDAVFAVASIAPMNSSTPWDDVEIRTADGTSAILVDSGNDVVTAAIPLQTSSYGSVSSPAIGIGDSNDGFYKVADTDIRMAINGVAEYTWANSTFNLNGNYLAGVQVATVAHTGDYTLVAAASDAYEIHHTIGASGLVTFTLPASPADGYVARFFSSTSNEVRIDPNTNEKILDPDMTGLADAEYITTSTQNSSITLISDDNGDWMVLSKTGTWAEETP